ncbi:MULTISPECIES: TRAP transporter substrate-binding protein [unclassified Brenneria]|uniref:TRAP transporter substrate-binding protein n=1 Tax=unclassified Brenneria TaxID=2634434 RepID=UPI001554D921|nr:MULTISPECIES: TRAP transporter substrate-binding protein [unclassified Brenneria]MBJ7222006.1 TRAP transporter substrate-binding protein [Brenneria sp. L3-3C-1]MEE3643249.1 TRAP transporter substrate-binding protein [Brenneria sp. L3_3C_1]MEE3650562.1 TRAP transporter substrate-binding protein [Brenneria sp. HEZEL_4_2_4]NPD00517.1 TRAP transporter substrate-binding protein [Brenneria sp. hezel4-2-4]
MKVLQKIPRTLSLASLIMAFCLGPVSANEKDKTIRLKMQSGYASSLAILGPVTQQLPKDIAAASDNSIRIQYFEPKGLVPNEGIFDAVSTGSIDMGYAGLSFFAQKNPALAFFDAVPFGMDANGLISWLEQGGGNDLRDKLLEKYKIKGLICGFNAPEAGGWFNKEINAVQDLRGLKMRIAGLGGRTYEKLGVSTQNMAGGDIYAALERGVIDAAEYSMPALDQNMGLYEIAKYYYFPGWHQTSSIQTLLINKDKWDGMSPRQQQAIQASCNKAVLESIAVGEAIQGSALDFIKSKGVQIKIFPQPILDDLNTAWQQVSEELSGNNAEFKAVADSYNQFQKSYSQWRALSAGNLPE